MVMMASITLLGTSPEIAVTQYTTTTTMVPQAPVAVSSILRRLGLPEEGLTPIEYESGTHEAPDISIKFSDVWYALRVALTGFRIFEQKNMWGALVAISILGIAILKVYQISTNPPDM
jgi:hypothetical protein